MIEKRKCSRFIVKLPVDVKSDDSVVSGVSVRISDKGLFIRSQKSFQTGMNVDIKLHISEETSCALKGVVRYSRKLNVLKQKNGMGIELTEKDQKYQELIDSIVSLG